MLKELYNSLKFQRDKLIEKLDVVPREEFEILKNCLQAAEAIGPTNQKTKN